jgi:hypothetical protein
MQSDISSAFSNSPLEKAIILFPHHFAIPHPTTRRRIPRTDAVTPFAWTYDCKPVVGAALTTG